MVKQGAAELDGQCWAEAEEGWKCLTSLWPLQAACDCTDYGIAATCAKRVSPGRTECGKRKPRRGGYVRGSMYVICGLSRGMCTASKASAAVSEW